MKDQTITNVFLFSLANSKIYFIEDFDDYFHRTLAMIIPQKKLEKEIQLGKVLICPSDFLEKRSQMMWHGNKGQIQTLFYKIEFFFLKLWDTRNIDLVVQYKYTVKMNYHVYCSCQYIYIYQTFRQIHRH